MATLRGSHAEHAALTLRDVDAALERIAATTGKGSAALRGEQLRALFERADPAEQDFLLRLLVGELRQGALEGAMVDAIAAAANLPVADVRRAAMFAGGLGTVARVALSEGSAGLARYAIALHRPVTSARGLAMAGSKPNAAVQVGVSTTPSRVVNSCTRMDPTRPA